MTELDAAARPELWGGLECSVVRVGNDCRNQFAETGHLNRPDDLDRIAALGIRTLRYPVSWETTAPDSPERCDWRFADERLARMRRLGLRPIAGLLHHGSGPRYTSMTDPDFPALLARHAGEVAARFPWIDLFTPVNEPLTTARFSGLYGHWYPHGRDMPTFLRCLVNECLATALAMRAIRRVNGAARLVQTEDLGKVFSTPQLQDQAEHENQRRWLSIDLLCGRVDRHHPWHATLLRSGIREAELALLSEGEGRPDILGINYYATSERYLDEALGRYPPCFHGGNGRQAYADVEALRIDLPDGETGARARLAEAWERYHLPLAVTEVHHGSTREEQLRWLAEVWDDAAALKRDGVDLRAVTAWSLLGALDWNSLLTRRHGHYEVGAFDIRGPRLRLTALGKALRQLSETGCITHPALDQKGWWRRDGRHYWPPAGRAPPVLRRTRSILIAGASGKLGAALARACAQRGLDITCPGRGELDVTDERQVAEAIRQHRPWAVINAAAPREAEDPRRQFRVTSLGAENLARACAAGGLPFVTFSSDRVFDGALERPYVEGDATAPACLIGRSKAEAERRVSRAHGDALIIRMSRLFGGDDDPALLLAGWARSRGTGTFFTATYLPDVVRAALDLLIDGETGTWHLPSHGALSRREMECLFPVAAQQARPAGRLVMLGSERARLMPSLAEALQRQKEVLAAAQPAPPCAVAAE
ncbi:family 1 glycosylhydrolase [Aestuariivirga litoralis]|uniref:family 1 glycosylhydrolase n=1 Tax=Aestuariivirga litoralis TaxID=2650924 RepID=UPI001FE0277C|nr:family 1 glycosylhydrolase [Aestuariivirga litoralis]